MLRLTACLALCIALPAHAQRVSSSATSRVGPFDAQIQAEADEQRAVHAVEWNRLEYEIRANRTPARRAAQLRNALTQEHQLETDAQTSRAGWLRSSGGAPGGIAAYLHPVLPQRAGTDQDERFFELTLRPLPSGDFRPTSAPRLDQLEPLLFDTCTSDHYFLNFPAIKFRHAPSAAELEAIRGGVSSRIEAWWPAGDVQYTSKRTQHFPIRRAAAPHMVRAIRASVSDVLGSQAAAAARVGRRCSFTGQADECGEIPSAAPEQFSSTDAAWHLRRMNYTQGAPNDPRVHIAIVDTGIDIGLVPHQAYTGAGLDPAATKSGERTHGTHMALIIRQLLGEGAGTLHSYPVFDDTNTSNHHRLAAALDRAIFGGDFPNNEPLVVNLSLGWAPELGQPRTVEVRGDGPVGHVKAVESGIGEAVRSVLDRAMTADAYEGRKIAIVAAAGNRPRGLDTASELRKGFGMDETYDDICLGKRSMPFQLFFPGEWQSTPTCEWDAEDNLAVDKRRLTWTASAIDADGLPSYLSAAGFDEEPPFVAPGELIVVDSANTPETQMTLPAVVTGSSASAAILSATVAYAQLLCMSGDAAGCQGGINRGALGRLLYAAGLSTGRAGRDADVEPVALNWCRTEAIMTCQAAIDCVNDQALEPGSRIFAHSDMCSGIFGRCRARSDCGAVPEADAPVWTQAYAQWFTCFSGAEEISLESNGTCDQSPCDYDHEYGELVVDQASLGSIGPQPGDVGCPTCFARVYTGIDVSLDAHIGISAKYPAATYFKSAALVLVADDGTSESFSWPNSLVQSWTPGYSFVSKNIVVGMDVNSKTKAVFRVRIVTPDNKIYDNESVIPLQF